MKRLQRPARTVLVGLLLGTLLSFAYLGAAQTSGHPLPLVTALQASAEAAEVSLIVADVPATEVYLPQFADDWRRVLVQLAFAHGLVVCEVGPNTLMVSGSQHAHKLCAPEPEEVTHVGDLEPVAQVAALAPVTVAPVTEPEAAALEAVRYRLRVMQLDESRAASLGIDWAGRAFETASLLAGGWLVAKTGMIPSPQLDEVIVFLEREGVAMRLEDLELGGVLGRPVTFNRGGSINVSLPSEGGGIQRTYSYGLQVTVTGHREGDGLLLDYVVTDSNPSNVTDPMNVQLTSTDTRAAVLAECGQSVVLASLYSERDEGQGAALPVAGRVPALGYLGGVGSDSLGRVAVVLTLDVACGVES